MNVAVKTGRVKAEKNWHFSLKHSTEIIQYKTAFDIKGFMAKTRLERGSTMCVCECACARCAVCRKNKRANFS